MKQNFNKFIGIITIAALMFTQSAPAMVWAEEAPAPVENTNVAPSTPENTNVAPTAPTAPNQGSTTATPTPAPSQDNNNTNTNNNGGSSSTTPSPEQAQKDAERQAAIKAAEDAYWAEVNKPKTGTVSNGNVGDTVVATGNATNGSASVTNANNNGAAVGDQSGTGAGTSGGAVVNSGNGAGSTNSGTSAGVVNNDLTQNNGAVVNNNANQSTITGENSSSGNVGNTVVKTGNANTSATAITNVNTNVDGVAVSEFNIADDHKGDIVLTPEMFAANCVSGCANYNGTVQNTGNGAYSDNNASASSDVNNTTTQNNDASVGNTMNLVANSGNNEASFNTGGDNIIYTGDANVSANALTFANNNIAGNVTYGVVNIYGNLEGDIILPEFSGGSVGSNGTTSSTVANNGNGVNSDNNAALNTSTTNNTNQNNDAVITNDLNIDTQTGNNSVDYATDGNNTIKTGSTNVDANVVNIANTNISGGTWWLVFINQAGNWIGQLVGSPDGSQMAGSAGTQFTVGPDGQVQVSNGAPTGTVSNEGNGAGSNNNATANSNVNNTTNQNNTADIHNTLNLSANTGGNNANFNTGGNSSVVTGDANVIANIVNFVNNNIVGNGKLAVTFVNVFGSWVGNFYTPDHPKPAGAPSVTDSRGGTTDQQTVNTTTNQTVNETVDQTAVDAAAYEQNEQAGGNNTVTNKNGNRTYYKGRSVSVVHSKEYGSNGTNNSTDTKIAGISTSNLGNTLFGSENKKVFHLNLAYIVLLIPLVGFAIIAKKLLINRLIAKKK